MPLVVRGAYEVSTVRVESYHRRRPQRKCISCKHEGVARVQRQRLPQKRETHEMDLSTFHRLLQPGDPEPVEIANPRGDGRIVLTCEHAGRRSEEHTSELQSLMRISYAVFCLKTKTKNKNE